MKKEYIIVTDSTTDFPDSYRIENNLRVVPLGFMIDGKNYKNYLDNRELSSTEFYNLIENGKNAKTFQVNPEEFYHYFEEIAKEGYDILGIFFSSGLSGTYNSSRIASERLKAEHPDTNIIIIDSLAASLGEGLLVDHAVRAKNRGMSLEENAKYIESIKLNISHWFTVMDMDTLKRGGRISSAAAFFAKTLNINPVLHVSNDGKLIARMKKIGRKAALNALVEVLVKTYEPTENEVVYISHANAYNDALKVARMIEEKTGIKEFLINEIGPVIGGHCGVGTIALFFFAKER